MAAQVGVARFQGAVRSYMKAIYLSDTTGVTAKFDNGSGANANGDMNVQFPENVYLADVSMAAAPAVTQLVITIDGKQTGDTLQIASQLAATANRVALAVPLPRGSRMGMVQLT